MKIEWLVDEEDGFIDALLNATGMLGRPLLIVLGVPRSRPFFPLDGGVTVPRELLTIPNEATPERWPDAVWHDYSNDAWEVGVSLAAETWERSGKAYLTYLLAHELEHARIALEGFALHTTLVRYNAFISRICDAAPFRYREPLEFMLDVAAMATAVKIHGIGAVKADIEALLESGDRADEERLRAQLDLRPSKVSIEELATSMIKADEGRGDCRRPGSGAGVFERFEGVHLHRSPNGGLDDHVDPALIRRAAEGKFDLLLGPR